MNVPVSSLLSLAFAGAGQTILLAFAWGFLGAVWARGPIALPYLLALFVYLNPTETTMVVTILGTVFAHMTTGLALKEALQYHISLPTPLSKLAGGITLARCGLFFHRRHRYTTFCSIIIFSLACFMGSFWSTFFAPTLVAWNINVIGSELDLNSTYFESQLGVQMVSSGSAQPQGNSLEIIDNGGLMSGIATALQTIGISEVLSFNGASYDVSTSGVFPAAPGFGSMELAEKMNTGLSFVGATTLLQQGLTADVTCSEIPSQAVGPPQNATVPVGIFNANVTYLNVYAYSVTCDQGNPAQQDYVVRPNNNTSDNLLSSLVCPYPVGRSGLDWSKFNVISQGNGKYQFLRSTTCEIIPKLTTSQVTYANGALNATVLSSTPLSSHNANLSLFLASVVQYQTMNSQGLGSNSFGDVLYAIAAFTDIVADDDITLNAGLIAEIYLRSGFSTYPTIIPADGQAAVTGYLTVTTVGWTKTHPIFLYTVLPMTFFAVFTYAAIGYVLLFSNSRNSQEPVAFDPTDPLHLILASSTLGAQHSLAEEFQDSGIQDYEKLNVKVTKDGPAGIGFIVVHGSNSAPLAGVTEPAAKDKSHV
ncbi:hypothetical protein V8E55_009090 [Tylopilus felleus]